MPDETAGMRIDNDIEDPLPSTLLSMWIEPEYPLVEPTETAHPS